MVSHGEETSLIIQFLTGRYNNAVPLVCVPTPKRTDRFFMIFSKCLETFVPEGAVVVNDAAITFSKPWSDDNESHLLEWGGAEI